MLAHSDLLLGPKCRGSKLCLRQETTVGEKNSVHSTTQKRRAMKILTHVVYINTGWTTQDGSHRQLNLVAPLIISCVPGQSKLFLQVLLCIKITAHELQVLHMRVSFVISTVGPSVHRGYFDSTTANICSLHGEKTLQNILVLTCVFSPFLVHIPGIYQVSTVGALWSCSASQLLVSWKQSPCMTAECSKRCIPYPYQRSFWWPAALWGFGLTASLLR